MDLRRFFIKPSIPEKIAVIHDIALNVWSFWDIDARKLFHRLDPQLFREVNHNPIELLYRIKPERYQEMIKDKGFLHELKQVHEKFKAYMEYEGSYSSNGEEKLFTKDDTIVYICMEYGLHESIPLYSGGLAVLAGDQLKAASDIGLPMVSFGLLYRHGYFNQRITPEGMQTEEFRENTWYLSVVREVTGEGGNPVMIEIPLKGETVWAKIWKIDVGKVPLYLLDTNVHQNSPKFRKITNMLYDPDRATRLEQELILGRGSIIALKALGISPKIYHLNEGHTAFTIVERLIDLMKTKGMTFEEAKAAVRYSTIFTTHTPVIEGNENFPDELIRTHLEKEVRQLGISMENFLSLGKTGKDKFFWLPAFAIRFSRFSNGVSKIHGSVARNMWKDLFPTMHERELPIQSITNGVHLNSWLSLQMTELFDRYIGPDYFHTAEQEKAWENINTIPDGEIWNAHRRRKEQVISFVRRSISNMMKQRGYCKHKIKDIEQVLNPDYLTIGFARRFTRYKRASLILRDPERLAAILTNKEKPVQIIFAGKAHPADTAGKELIKKIFDFINNYPVENHVVFIEDYDINVARHLVQGVDVWLNTPTKLLEASGTSGIKAGINGVLNLSILDGWWPEAFNNENGWAISSDINTADTELREEIEANQLYEILENEIVEAYYNRTESDQPLEWVRMMKNSITTVCHGFNMHRTVRDYLNKFYLKQCKMLKRITENNASLIRDMITHRGAIDAVWDTVYLKDYFTSIDGKIPLSGEDVTIDCYVHLGNADQNLIRAEVFYSYGSDAGAFKCLPLLFVEKYEDKVAKYSGKIHLEGIGLQEMAARVVPANDDFREFYPEYIKWKV